VTAFSTADTPADASGVQPVIVLGFSLSLLPVLLYVRTVRREARLNARYSTLAAVIEREDPPPPTAG
jgi:hypothetical protein